MSTTAWQRSTLPLLILTVLSAAPRHGYGVSQALAEAGLHPIKGAQLYPALARLEGEGIVVAQWEQSEAGPARKVYELTAVGRTRLEALRTEWRDFATAVEHLGG